jgi:hypothetical protein
MFLKILEKKERDNVLLDARGPLILKADGPIYFSKKTLDYVSFDFPIFRLWLENHDFFFV